MAKTSSPPPLADAAHLLWQRSVHRPAYACLPELRGEMRRFLDLAAVPREYAESFCLSLCEVVSNLVKHPRQKAATVRISLEVLPQSLRLDIADDSTPFAAFDAICKTARGRLRSGETLAESGYGLGCILTQHTHVSYTAALHSTDGQNHFVIEDPLGDAPVPAAHKAPPQKRPVVFLVDDSAADLKAHHRMLADDYDIVPLADAASALSLFRIQRPDLVVSDLHMPQTDGIALRKSISGLPDGNLVPFIFLTASAEGLNDPGILRIGIDDYILKPASQQGLLRVTKRVLGRREQLKRALEGRFHRDLKKYLHPYLPDAVGPWRIATFNRMAEAGGGDFTLHHDTPEGLMAVLADVMGHGLEAKFFAYAYAGYLRSLLKTLSKKSSPLNTADFLQCLSDAVIDDDFLDGTLMTCQSFHFAPDGQAGISSAGHPPPLLLTANGQAEVLPVAGALPGLAARAGYREYRIRLQPGDKLLFATDGFFDVLARHEGGHDGAALLPLLPPLAGQTALQAAQALWETFEKAVAQDTIPADDATLIIAAYGE